MNCLWADAAAFMYNIALFSSSRADRFIDGIGHVIGVVGLGAISLFAITAPVKLAGMHFLFFHVRIASNSCASV